ncbi:hypothetical protein [Sulfitobacter guttiformis]|uniref:Uncharacterized protein n=1 Tax=Sulfitobacter guttiformis TaxID=74349 RepID=A0A420DNT0_9RHOB|nr:hypothetical protein [Sulfitobacter guttiformis]KIN73210.1 hypothetical protein Z949_2396 [Sulfitobacter guttiformis KCTC 32187]RKE95885.1 hypothetical protein C8N30_0430 [Sulfitobacter guttiformis]
MRILTDLGSDQNNLSAGNFRLLDLFKASFSVDGRETWAVILPACVGSGDNKFGNL